MIASPDRLSFATSSFYLKLTVQTRFVLKCSPTRSNRSTSASPIVSAISRLNFVPIQTLAKWNSPFPLDILPFLQFTDKRLYQEII